MLETSSTPKLVDVIVSGLYDCLQDVSILCHFSLLFQVVNVTENLLEDFQAETLHVLGELRQAVIVSPIKEGWADHGRSHGLR